MNDKLTVGTEDVGQLPDFLQKAKPIPLNLDWESPRGIEHHAQMCALPADDPVAIAHFENIGQPHPAAASTKG